MTILDWTNPEHRALIEEHDALLRKAFGKSDLVRLTAVIITDFATSEKRICISKPDPKPCGLIDERWLPVHAEGSTLTDTYEFNGEQIKGRDNVVARMKECVRENYAEFLN